MKRTIRILGLLVAAIMSLTALFTGCTQSPAPAQSAPAQGSATAAPATPEPLKEVKLVMYLIGDQETDSGIVYDEVNKKMKADINTTVEVKFISWADWSSKYALVFASGEDFDTIYTAYWSYYIDQANKKGFLELNKDMLQKNMPDYYQQVPPEFWDQVKVNGKMYMIPFINKQIVGHYLLLTRGDLAEKYSIPQIKTQADFESYVKAVIKGEPGMLGLDGDRNEIKDFVHNFLYKEPNNLMFLSVNPPLFTVAMDDPTGKVIYTLDDQRYVDVLKKTKEYCDAGFWSKNVLANQILNGENFRAGKSCFITHHTESMITFSGETLTNHPEWKPVVTDLYPDKIHESNPGTRSGMGIHATSKNPERVMMMMNLFGTHKDYYDLTTYGIEGVHYTPVGDNRLKSTDLGLKNFKPKANCPWGWENKKFMRYPDNTPDYVVNFESDWMAKGLAATTPVLAFNFVTDNVKNELAACDNIWQTQGFPLLAGLVGDPVAGVQKMKADLKSAGVEKIQAEIQKQLTEYLGSIK